MPRARRGESPRRPGVSMEPMHPARAALLALSLLLGSAPASSAPSRAAEELALPAVEPLALGDVAALVRAAGARAEVQLELDRLAELLRRRDLAGLQQALDPLFQGQAWLEPRVDDPERARQSLERLPLGATRRRLALSRAAVDAPTFVGLLGAPPSRWSRPRADLRLVRARFEPAEPSAGVLAEVELLLAGEEASGAAVALEASLRMRLVHRGERWRLQACTFESATELRREAGPLFRDVTRACGLRDSGGAAHGGSEPEGAGALACADLDRDGLLDLFVPTAERAFLYMGAREGIFSEEAQERGLAEARGGRCAVFLDLEGDGDPDLVVGHAGGRPLQAFVNDGHGRFEERAEELGCALALEATALCVLDVERDGWPDLFVCGGGAEPPPDVLDARGGGPNALLANQEGRGFRERAAEAGVAGEGWSSGCAAADVDGDGLCELFVTREQAPPVLYKNLGDGRFAPLGGLAGLARYGSRQGAAFGDLDGDTRLDLVLAGAGSAAGRAVLEEARELLPAPLRPVLAQMAEGGGVFLSQADARFLFRERGGDLGLEQGPVLFDVDLDGRLDLFCTRGGRSRAARDEEGEAWCALVASLLGEPLGASFAARRRAGELAFAGGQRDLLALGTGDGRFVDLGPISGADSARDGRGALAVDLDEDGDCDLAVVDARGGLRILRNELDRARGGFVQVRLVAAGGSWEALGAAVTCETSSGACTQVLARGAGRASSQPPALVFGTGGDRTAHLRVRWPSGVVESFAPVSAESRVLLIESIPEPEHVVVQRRALPDPAPAGLALRLGEELPPLELMDVEGRPAILDPRTLAAGEGLLLAFVSVDCAPSLDDLLALGRRAAEGERVAAVVLDPPEARARAWTQLEERAPAVPAFYRASASAEELEAWLAAEELALPTTWVIDGEGRLGRVIEHPLALDQAERSTRSPSEGESPR